MLLLYCSSNADTSLGTSGKLTLLHRQLITRIIANKSTLYSLFNTGPTTNNIILGQSTSTRGNASATEPLCMTKQTPLRRSGELTSCIFLTRYAHIP